ncbi:unnamed protein product [Dicrocoelium dendriticum]|nr:unnamed protein product [Dicrocoelium dendriticum]
MYSSYLEEYHGALTEFHTRSFNLFTTQVSRDRACMEFSVGSSIRIWVSENHPAILFTCTDVFMRKFLLYAGNRLMGGLCHIRIRSKKDATYGVQFLRAQWAGLEHYQCVWSARRMIDFQENLLQRHCSIRADPSGDISCVCNQPGYVTLVQLASAKIEKQSFGSSSSHTRPFGRICRGLLMTESPEDYLKRFLSDVDGIVGLYICDKDGVIMVSASLPEEMPDQAMQSYVMSAFLSSVQQSAKLGSGNLEWMITRYQEMVVLCWPLSLLYVLFSNV